MIDRYNKFVSLGALYDILADIASDGDLTISEDDLWIIEGLEKGTLNIISDDDYTEMENRISLLQEFLDNYYNYGQELEE